MAALKAAKPAQPTAAAWGPALAASTPPVMQPGATPFFMSFLARNWHSVSAHQHIVFSATAHHPFARRCRSLARQENLRGGSKTYTFDTALGARKDGAHEAKVLGRAVAATAHVLEAATQLFPPWQVREGLAGAGEGRIVGHLEKPRRTRVSPQGGPA